MLVSTLNDASCVLKKTASSKRLHSIEKNTCSIQIQLLFRLEFVIYSSKVYYNKDGDTKNSLDVYCHFVFWWLESSTHIFYESVKVRDTTPPPPSPPPYFRWKVKWRLENLGALGIMGEMAPLTSCGFWWQGLEDLVNDLMFPAKEMLFWFHQLFLGP